MREGSKPAVPGNFILVLDGEDAEFEVTVKRSRLLGLTKREDIRFLFNPRLLNDDDEIVGPLTIEAAGEVLKGMEGIPARLKIERRESGDGGELTFSPEEAGVFQAVTINLRDRTESGNGAPEVGEPGD